MNRTFKELPEFTKKWMELGLTDDDLKSLQEILLKNPETGDVIPGAGSNRKIRIPLGDIGKRGGARVIYIDIKVEEAIYLIDVYAKTEQVNLSQDDIKLLKKISDVLKGGIWLWVN